MTSIERTAKNLLILLEAVKDMLEEVGVLDAILVDDDIYQPTGDCCISWLICGVKEVLE